MSNHRKIRPDHPAEAFFLPPTVVRNLDRLSDEQLGFHVIASTWSIANGTHGFIPNQVAEDLADGWTTPGMCRVGAWAREHPNHPFTLAGLFVIAGAL